MKHRFTLTYILLLFTILSGCAPEIEPPVLDKNGLDFSRFIAIGGSMTAGVSNGNLVATGELSPQGGLYEKAQMMSYPYLMSRSFSYLGDEVTFNQPLVQGNGSGFSTIKEFQPHPCGNLPDQPIYERHTSAVATPWYETIPQNGPFHNVGMPGLSIRDYSNTWALNENLLAMGMGWDTTSTYQDWVSALNPTFFCLSVGMEELMRWVYKGAPANDMPMEPGELETRLLSMLDQLGANEEVEGAVANIPDFTMFPFFRQLSHTAVDESCQRVELFVGTGPQDARVIQPEEAILLPAAKNISPVPGTVVMGSEVFPLPHKFVLDRDELATLREFISLYNAAILSAVNTVNQKKPNLALVDLYEMFQEIESGITMNGDMIDGRYLYGGFFSLDGLHPTGRGNAMISNRFIGAINDHFQTIIPGLNPVQYPTVSFP